MYKSFKIIIDFKTREYLNMDLNANNVSRSIFMGALVGMAVAGGIYINSRLGII